MDILIQQDGRIQTNQRIDPSLRYFRTAEIAATMRVGHQYVSDFSIYGRATIPIIERTFVRIGTVGNITVWVEQR